MSENEFWKLLGAIEAREHLGEEFVAAVNEMIGMLDSADMDDYFGTEGWRYNLGWE